MAKRGEFLLDETTDDGGRTLTAEAAEPSYAGLDSLVPNGDRHGRLLSTGT
jgi:hypothetical protein